VRGLQKSFTYENALKIARTVRGKENGVYGIKEAVNEKNDRRRSVEATFLLPGEMKVDAIFFWTVSPKIPPQFKAN
jgi:hypothetical protein